jgi:hypothetical protein
MASLSTNDIIAIALIGFSVIILVGGGCGVLLWYALSYRFKHTVEFIKLMKHGRKVIIKKARPVFDKKNNIEQWKIRFPKEVPKFINIPKNLVMDFNRKGNLFARVYISESEDIVMAQAEHPIIISDLFEKLGQIPEEIKKEEDIRLRQNKYDAWRKAEIDKFHEENKGKNTIIMNPVTSNQRIMLTNQLTKAVIRREQKSDRIQMIMNISMVIILALVIVFLVIYLKDLAKPAIDKQKEITAQKALDMQQWEIIREINTGMIKIQSRLGIENNVNGTQGIAPD